MFKCVDVAVLSCSVLANRPPLYPLWTHQRSSFLISVFVAVMEHYSLSLDETFDFVDSFNALPIDEDTERILHLEANDYPNGASTWYSLNDSNDWPNPQMQPLVRPSMSGPHRLPGPGFPSVGSHCPVTRLHSRDI